MKNMLSSLVAASLLCGTVSLADEDQKSEPAKTQEKSISISVKTNSESSSEDDGESTSSFSGRIVVVGPDGKKKEYDLGDKLPAGFKRMSLGGNNLSMLFQEEEQEERYIIGVMCEPASDLLQAHLKLEGQGLVVTHVSDGMPAAEAGIAKNDILLTIGDAAIQKLDDLIKAVAASEGKELKLTVLKNGDQQDLTVTPKMSTGGGALHGLPHGISEMVLRGDAGVDLDIDIEELKNATGKMILRRIGPGIRINDTNDFKIDSIIEIAEEAAKEGSASVDLQKQMKTLRKRLAQMEKQMNSLEEKSAKD